ncbi:hypothetical protein LOAG_01720, partial [Loa loa]
MCNKWLVWFEVILDKNGQKKIEIQFLPPKMSVFIQNYFQLYKSLVTDYESMNIGET